MNAYYKKSGKPPGPKARIGGTLMKRNEEVGRSMQIMVYVRTKTKEVIVKAADAAGQRVSNYIKWTVLETVAKEKNCKVEDLIPKSEFEELQRSRGRRTGNAGS
jgi:hypothetical protein